MEKEMTPKRMLDESPSLGKLVIRFKKTDVGKYLPLGTDSLLDEDTWASGLKVNYFQDYWLPTDQPYILEHKDVKVGEVRKIYPIIKSINSERLTRSKTYYEQGRDTVEEKPSEER
jgi:hypothetical protein